MRKILLLVLVTIFFYSVVDAQHSSQLRLRLGATKTIVSQGKSADNTIYKMYDKRSPIPSGIGFEFWKPLKEENASWFIGSFLEFQPYQSGINSEKFQTIQGGYGSLSSYGCIRFYAGFDQRIGKKKLPVSKNYFTVFGGAGISYNLGENDSGSGGSSGEGVTKDGRYFTGIYKDFPSFPAYSGIMTWETHTRSHTFTPDLFAGLRWNIMNKKGNIALALELVGNYGIIPKYYHYYNYSLDNIPQVDRLKDHGVNVQLNILIPLKNFKNRKNR